MDLTDNCPSDPRCNQSVILMVSLDSLKSLTLIETYLKAQLTYRFL